MNGTVLIIDDEEQLRKLMARLVGLEHFHVLEAGDFRTAGQLLKTNSIDVVLCDVRLPDGNGVDFVKTARQQYPNIEIILLTAYGNIADGVQAIKNGAFDYLQKGDENERVLPLLFQAMEKVRRQKESAIKINPQKASGFDSIIGNSPLIQSLVAQGKRISQTDAAVLLLGETGTGKEVFANAIHYQSKRRNHSLVAINCSAFSRELLEGELFGHKAGAFTGALKEKKGLVELADQGTLFLDEIGEMPLELQAKLLRFLETGEFIKVGDTKTTRIDVRLIAATNRNLEDEIRLGHFREDLFYRLNVFTLELPALRNRAVDIPLLANFFLERFNARLRFSAEAMQSLQNHNWPGNIRELRNVVQRAAIMADEQEIGNDLLPAAVQHPLSQDDQFLLASIERQHINKILQHTNGNKTKAAQLLGIGIATLYRKLEEYRLG